MLRAVLWAVVVFGAYAHNGHHGGTTVSPAEPSSPVVETPLGRIQGSWMETRRGRKIQAFRGVRYAQPPVGELRFKAPQRLTRYDGTALVDASSEGPACPQPVVTPGYLVDEDCLRLNVYAPERRDSVKLLPVIVYIHPGGFYSVSGRSDIAGPHYLLERDIVLVSINYRLGTLGFLSTGDEHAPGNYGFKDQVQALRWVQENIRSFGGDPNLVTVAGYSAGSLSIALLMVSPMAKGLFHRAISMSASPISQVVIGRDQRHLAVRQAQLLGCPTAGNQEMVACLRGKSWKEIGDSLDGMFEFGYDPILLWNVVLEPQGAGERFITEQPLESIKRGRMHSVPYIISRTTDEFFWKAFDVQKNETLFSKMKDQWEQIAPISFMLPLEDDVASKSHRLRLAYFGHDHVALANNTKDMAALGNLYSDSVIGFAVHRLANLMCRHSRQPVYYYEFAYIGNHSHYEDSTGKPTGAAHHDDLIYLFTIPASFPAIELHTTDNTIVDKMTAIWWNFARFGDPNLRPDTPELENLFWPAMTSQDKTYLRIGKEFSVDRNLFENRYRVWDELYPIKY